MPTSDDKIRPEVRALVARGNITDEDWKEFEDFQFEEFVVCLPHVKDEAFLNFMETVLQSPDLVNLEAGSMEATIAVLLRESMARFKKKNIQIDELTTIANRWPSES